jgi:hypothetical protein
MAARGKRVKKTAAAPSKSRRAAVRLLRLILVDQCHVRSVGFFDFTMRIALIMSFLLRKFDFSGAGSGKKKVLYKRFFFPVFHCSAVRALSALNGKYRSFGKYMSNPDICGECFDRLSTGLPNYLW